MISVRQLKNSTAACVIAGAAAWLAATPASAYTNTNVVKQVHHDTSPPLREMIRLYAQQHPGGDGNSQPFVIPVKPLPLPKQPLQRDGISGSGELPIPVPTTDLLNFDGISVLCGCAPPDTNGAVGATQYVQWVNLQFAIYDKASGSLISGPTNGNALWSGFGGACQNNNSGDPIAQYDKAAGRWVMMQPVFASPYYLCVAVSQTSDATGSYNRYAFQMPANSDFPDYPKLGIWPATSNQGYFLTANIFQNGSNFIGAMLIALDRANMLNGNAATMQYHQLSSSYGGVLPADFDGSTLPPSASQVEDFVNFGSNDVNFWQAFVDFQNPQNTTWNGPTTISVPSFTRLCFSGCVPQGSTTQKLDALGDRMMYRLAYRNLGDHESLVTDHSVSVNTRGAVRWYEFRNAVSPVLYQSGNVKNRSLWYWMGSIAMDKMGDIAVGYSDSSSTVHPGITYSGRTPGQTLGKIAKHAGGNTYTGNGSETGGLSRWGDYSAMSMDPSDDCTFYYTTEYIPSNGSFNWHTRINSFKFNTCS